MGRLSIRAKLTAAFAAAMLLLLALAGLFTYLQVRSNLTEALDENLNSRADDLSALVVSADRGPPDLEGERVVESEDSFAQVLSPDGRVLASTLPAAAGAAIAPTGAEQLVENPVPGVDGEAKILARPIDSGGRTSVIVVGATTADRTETLTGLTGAFLLGGPVAILIASGIGYLLAGRALAPVESMRRRAAGITLERSGERLPLPTADDEIRRLGRTLNEMLDRIESSLERERAFVSDASHELRTPLAILRTELELAGRPGRTPQELGDAVNSAAEEVDRLSRLAEDLLVIARSDQGRLPIKREPIELAKVLERIRDRFARSATEAGREIAVEAPDGARAELDPMRIEQALGNLIDNALRHGEGAVLLSASLADGRAVFEVSDQGPGLPDGFEDRAFERLTRADEGRTGGGTGLGLAIVRAIAQAHGGEASASSRGDGRASVRISLPAHRGFIPPRQPPGRSE